MDGSTTTKEKFCHAHSHCQDNSEGDDIDTAYHIPLPLTSATMACGPDIQYAHSAIGRATGTGVGEFSRGGSGVREFPRGRSGIGMGEFPRGRSGIGMGEFPRGLSGIEFPRGGSGIRMGEFPRGGSGIGMGELPRGGPGVREWSRSGSGIGMPLSPPRDRNEPPRISHYVNLAVVNPSDYNYDHLEKLSPKCHAPISVLNVRDRDESPRHVDTPIAIGAGLFPFPPPASRSRVGMATIGQRGGLPNAPSCLVNSLSSCSLSSVSSQATLLGGGASVLSSCRSDIGLLDLSCPRGHHLQRNRSFRGFHLSSGTRALFQMYQYLS